jgi:hypothetical protein
MIFPHMIPSFFAGVRLGKTGALFGVQLAGFTSRARRLRERKEAVS